ncbi:MAG: hypothetical protein ACTSSP_01070 [Candidatus Asgardarchaeia archaeon]
MACPNQGILNGSISFTIRTLDSEDAPVWADSAPTYTVYEETTNETDKVSGLDGLSMLADDNTLGLYYAIIDLDSTLFELYKTYIIVIGATISGNSVARTYTFVVVGTDDVIGEGLIDNVNAVADFRGSFKQGSGAVLNLKITTFDGTPIDPYRITVTITGPVEDDSASHEADSGTPFQAARGFYVYEWFVAADAPTGTYVVDWEYFVDEIERHEYQNVMVTADTTVPGFYSYRFIAFRTALEHHIGCAQSIPVYYEQAKPSYDLRTFQFSFPEWNQSAGARVYRNELLISSGIEVDYGNGKVRFSEALMPQEVVHVDYNFRWFDEDKLNRFLLNALQTVNIYPPHSGYTLENLPDRYTTIVLYGAAKDAFRQIMGCLPCQQPAQVFGGLENAQKAFANFETLKQNYEKDWEKLLEQKKYGPYPTTRMVVTPEYTLPGGRSRWFRYLFKG